MILDGIQFCREILVIKKIILLVSACLESSDSEDSDYSPESLKMSKYIQINDFFQTTTGSHWWQGKQRNCWSAPEVVEVDSFLGYMCKTVQ